MMTIFVPLNEEKKKEQSMLCSKLILQKMISVIQTSYSVLLKKKTLPLSNVTEIHALLCKLMVKNVTVTIYMVTTSWILIKLLFFIS